MMPALVPYSINCAASVTSEGKEKPKDHLRLVLLGAARVGKTAIVQQLLYNKFPTGYSATVEEMHRAEYEVDGCSLTLEILDTSGAYAFPAMRRLAISRGDYFVLVFSIDNGESFEEVGRLKESIFELRSPEVPMVVVANKSDLSNCRRVSKEIAETVVTIDWEKVYIECSAKTGYNVLDIFTELLLRAQIHYSLRRAVEKRRHSLPIPYKSNVANQKRNSCVIS